MNMLKRLASLLVISLVAACGGGGGDAGTSPFTPPTNLPPGPSVNPTADLIVELSKSSVANTGSDSIIITTTVLDAARSTIADAKLVVGADSDSIVTTPASVTGADGKLQSTLTIGANRANRVITVTVTSGSVTKTATVQVFGAKLTGTLAPPVIEPGKSGKIQYRLTDQAGNPMSDQEFHVVAAGLTPTETTGKTGVNGDFEFAYTAPAPSASYDVSATAGGSSDSQSLQVQAASTIPAVTTAITSASVSANPSVVGTNLVGANANRSEIRALFLGSNNLPIKNVRVRFDLDGDLASIGGSFTTDTGILYSDVNGVTTTSYVPAARSSPTNGVTVRACYYKSDAEAAADPYDASGKVTVCANAARVTLTVTSEPLGVSIGTNELIIVNELTYVKKFVVTVVDSAGVAKPDVNIAVSVDLPQYRKGVYAFFGDRWDKILVPGVPGVSGVPGDPTAVPPIPAIPPIPEIPPVIGDKAVCTNEDTNRNGVLETGEDINNSGRLDPGKSDVSVTLLQSRTRSDGTVELQLQYAKSFGSWVDVKITVAASGVAGTEGRATYLVAPVPVDAASIKNKDVSPAYVVSPYGRAPSCTDSR
jgi:hypothetical protein